MWFVFVIISMFPLVIIYLSSCKGNGNEKFRTNNNNYFEKKQNLSDILAGSIKKQN